MKQTRIAGEPFVVAGHALAPFTADQAASLNAYQHGGVMHEFTCGNDSRHFPLVALIGDGWTCLDCDYTQNWAHDWMADWTWQTLRPVTV